ncbi:hypothetical protein [Pseudoxanthomonas sp. Root630]|uniref:hypothetical protein n=1 Tax=Pseudoxanthomonas sp. Root630 TaxID=1736574 RepID=UPI0012DC146E|nr:hypothetical protein [Pseudoxanthomonas sp. Root630]
MQLWKLFIVVGVAALCLAALLIAISIREAVSISVYTDPPLGQSLIIPLVGAGIIAIGYGIAYKRRG